MLLGSGSFGQIFPRTYVPINSSGVPQVYTSRGTTRIVMPNANPVYEKEEPKNPHQSATFARIFANEIALRQLRQNRPVFEPGSVIVREKLLRETHPEPELVTVMIKRDKGFSPKSGDWEFIVLDGKAENIKSRERTGSCSKCHTQANETDLVFKTYLK